VLPDHSEISFYYKAINQAGKTVTGEVAARERKEAVEKLHAQGLVPVQVTPKTSKRKRWQFGKRQGALSGQETLLFAEELAVLLESGLPLEESLGMLSRTFQGTLQEKTLFCKTRFVLVKRWPKRCKTARHLPDFLSAQLPPGSVLVIWQRHLPVWHLRKARWKR